MLASGHTEGCGNHITVLAVMPIAVPIGLSLLTPLLRLTLSEAYIACRYTCPICCKSMVNMSAVWEQMDVEVRAEG